MNLGLTLTWDVFKYPNHKSASFLYIRLTLTWDVFKFLHIAFNPLLFLWLTLTWDVFKYKPDSLELLIKLD